MMRPKLGIIRKYERNIAWQPENLTTSAKLRNIRAKDG
jgi:hypothetical protein